MDKKYELLPLNIDFWTFCACLSACLSPRWERADGLEIEFSEEVTDNRLKSLQLKIKNLGLVLIILIKSQKFLKRINMQYYMESIGDAAILSAIKDVDSS